MVVCYIPLRLPLLNLFTTRARGLEVDAANFKVITVALETYSGLLHALVLAAAKVGVDLLYCFGECENRNETNQCLSNYAHEHEHAMHTHTVFGRLFPCSYLFFACFNKH